MSASPISLRYRSATHGDLQDVSTVHHVRYDEEEDSYTFYMETARGDRGALRLPAAEVIPVDHTLYIVTRDIASDPLLDLEEFEHDLEAPLGQVPHSQSVKLPVIEERLEVRHRIKPVGTLHVDKRVERTTEQVLAESIRQEAQIERRSCQRVLEDGEDASHYTLEDGSLVIPIVEERAIVTIERVVTEEVIVRKVTHVEPVTEHVELRSSRVDTTYESA